MPVWPWGRGLLSPPLSLEGTELHRACDPCREPRSVTQGAERRGLCPGCRVQKPLRCGTKGSPKLRVGTDTTRALSQLEHFLLHFPPLSDRRASLGPFKGGGTVRTAELWWRGPCGLWSLGRQCIQLGPLLTGATWPDPGGGFQLSGQRDALFPEILTLSSLRMSLSLSLFFVENNLGERSGCVCSLHFLARGPAVAVTRTF